MKIDLTDKEITVLQGCMRLLPKDTRFIGIGYEEVNKIWDKLWHKLASVKAEGKENDRG